MPEPASDGGGLRSLRPSSPALKTLLVAADSLALTVVYLLFLRALLLLPTGYSSVTETAVLGGGLASLLLLFHALMPFDAERTHGALVFQFAFWFGMATALALLANSTMRPGWDWTWLRIEMVKVPLWAGMLLPLMPGFAAAATVLFAVLIRVAVVRPASRWVRWPPTVALLVLLWLCHSHFPTASAFRAEGSEPSWFRFLMLFCGPLMAVVAMLWARRASLAFRLVPAAFYCSMVGLNYMAVLPVHSLHDLVPQSWAIDPPILAEPGVRRVHPPAGTSPDRSFLFLRGMAGLHDHLFVSYGPTCGVYGFDLASGALANLEFQGTMRKLAVAPDGIHLWGLNWQTGRFLAMRTEPSLSLTCSQDLFPMGLRTPWDFVVQGDRMFVSNVTPPVIAELAMDRPGQGCPLTLRRMIDFHENGYTGFTDGVFALHLDAARGRLYALVGMLEGTSDMGFLEIDPDSFQVLRELRLPAGMKLEPVEGRGTVLLPNYWGRELYEVSLADMKVVRTLDGVPNVMGMVYDPRRRLIFALSRAGGEMAVLDYASGSTLRTLAVGAKPEAIWLDPGTSRLFVGSSLGILEFDIDALVPPPAD